MNKIARVKESQDASNKPAKGKREKKSKALTKPRSVPDNWWTWCVTNFKPTYDKLDAERQALKDVQPPASVGAVKEHKEQTRLPGFE